MHWFDTYSVRLKNHAIKHLFITFTNVGLQCIFKLFTVVFSMKFSINIECGICCKFHGEYKKRNNFEIQPTILSMIWTYECIVACFFDLQCTYHIIAIMHMYREAGQTVSCSSTCIKRYQRKDTFIFQKRFISLGLWTLLSLSLDELESDEPPRVVTKRTWNKHVK